LIGVTNSKLKPVYLEPRHESKYAWSTWEKSVDLLDFKHNIELEEGLLRMWEWALKQPKRPRFIWPNYELDKGLYEYWKV
jgi:nucleoside-diphosphate-sugar epimerase